jgi:hypothetical protein
VSGKRTRTLRRLTAARAAALPPPSPVHLAAHWEHCCNVLALAAIDVQAAWLEVLALLESREVLVIGSPVPAPVARMDLAVRELSKGPGQ